MSQRQFVSGRVRIPDARDAKYPMRIPKQFGARRNWRTPDEPTNQGNRPICVAVAWLHLLESSPIRQGSAIDPEGLYHYGQMEDEWGGEDYEGTSVRGVAKVLRRFGVIGAYRWERKAKRLARFVSSCGPVVFGSDWYEGMDSPNEAGIMTLEGDNLGGHAFLICGFNPRNGMFRMLNNWGPDWGRGGFAYLSMEDADSLLEDGAEACCAEERAAK